MLGVTPFMDTAPPAAPPHTARIDHVLRASDRMRVAKPVHRSQNCKRTCRAASRDLAVWELVPGEWDELLALSVLKPVRSARMQMVATK